MASYPSPHELPKGPSVTFFDSSFFTRGSETPTLPTPSEILARPTYIQHPFNEKRKLRVPSVFKELGLVVKHGKSSNTIISEGQCLWVVGRFLPGVSVPELYGWTQEDGRTFLYMEYIDGATLHDRWGTLAVTEKDGVCEQLKKIITEISQLRQAPDDQFIGRAHVTFMDPVKLNCRLGNINRGPLGDFIFTGTNHNPAGPFTSVTGLHDYMSDMVKWPAKMRNPGLDPTLIPDPYRDMLPDDSPIHFTHADLNPLNIMVSKDSPCHVMAILDWEQSGWYPAYWEFCKAEYATEVSSEWQTVYLPRILDEPDCCEGFYSYANAFGP